MPAPQPQQQDDLAADEVTSGDAGAVSQAAADTVATGPVSSAPMDMPQSQGQASSVLSSLDAADSTEDSTAANGTVAGTEDSISAMTPPPTSPDKGLHHGALAEQLIAERQHKALEAAMAVANAPPPSADAPSGAPASAPADAAAESAATLNPADYMKTSGVPRDRPISCQRGLHNRGSGFCYAAVLEWTAEESGP